MTTTQKANKYPLKDGDTFTTNRGQETVGGEIKVSHQELVCWTIQGNWYRRSDGVEMTGLMATEEEGAITVIEAYKRKSKNKD